MSHIPNAPTQLTENEAAWVEFLRLICNDKVPPPKLASVQGLRLILAGKPIFPPDGM